MSSDPTSELSCPVCGAKQLPSSICRRCKCDLSLLVATTARQHALHAETLRLLREGRPNDAIRVAQQRWHVDPDEDAARLLAICCLVQGHLQTALDVLNRFFHLRKKSVS